MGASQVTSGGSTAVVFCSNQLEAFHENRDNKALKCVRVRKGENMYQDRIAKYYEGRNEGLKKNVGNLFWLLYQNYTKQRHSY